MSDFARSILVAGAITLSSITAAIAAPKDQTCEFVKAILTNDSEFQTKALGKLVGHWSAGSIGNIQKNFSGSVRSVKFTGGKIFETANLGGDMIEHFVLLRRAKGGLSYVRLHYIWFPDGNRVEYVSMENNYPTIMKFPFAQPPEKVSCGFWK